MIQLLTSCSRVTLPYRDLGEDVDKQVEHSQGDRNPVATKALPQVFRHRGDLVVRAQIKHPAFLAMWPPGHQLFPFPSSFPNSEAQKVFLGFSMGDLRRKEKMRNKRWDVEELGLYAGVCTLLLQTSSVCIYMCTYYGLSLNVPSRLHVVIGWGEPFKSG